MVFVMHFIFKMFTMSIKYADIQYKCDQCGAGFSRKVLLKKHLKSNEYKENMPNRPAFECNKCGKTFTRKDNLQNTYNVMKAFNE